MPAEWTSAFESRKTQIHIGETLAALSTVFCCRDDLQGMRLTIKAPLQTLLPALRAVVMWLQS